MFRAAALVLGALLVSGCGASTRLDAAPAMLASLAPDADEPPQPRSSPLAGPAPGAPPPGEAFSFLVAGHLYGDPGTLSGAPSPTLISAVRRLARGNDRLLVSTGDFVRSLDDAFLTPTIEVFSHLDMPVFNAPGNHDYRAGEYERRFGSSFGCLRQGPALLVLLNTERSRWNLDAEQLAFLRQAVDWVAATPEVRHLFVFGHKLVFAAGEPRYEVLFRNANARDGWTGSSNFREQVLPMLRELIPEHDVTWFAGDVGVAWSASLFHDVHPEWGVRFVACGLGSTPRDVALRVHVPATGDGAAPDRVAPDAGAGVSTGAGPVRARLELVPLPEGATRSEGEPLTGSVSDHGLEAWRARFEG